MTDVTDTTQLNTDADDQTTLIAAGVGVAGIILGLAVGTVAAVLLTAIKGKAVKGL